MPTGKTQIIGHFDEVWHGSALGWVIDKSNPQKAITVQAVVDGKVLAESHTHIPRPDLNWERAGFAIPLPQHCFKIEDCEIQIEVKEQEGRLVLTGGPKKINLEQRFSFFIDGFVERNKITGWLKDHANEHSGKCFTVQLFENETIIASAKSDGMIDEGGESGRFVIVLPDTVLDEAIHEFTFCCAELELDLGTRKFFTPSSDPSRDYLPPPFLDDPVWEQSPAGKQVKEQWIVEASRNFKTDKKIEALKKRLAKTKTADNQYRYNLVCEIAHLLKDESKPQEALECFRAAIVIDPMQLQAYTAVVDILLVTGKENEAEIWLRKALQKLPEHPELLSRLDTLLALRHTKQPAKIIAFYLPQFHPTPENDRWWGKGFTEWANVTAAKPLFDGHLQPRRPTALGYYDLRLPDAANAQFELARRYGIDGFCYYYYWFEGKRILERPLQDLVEGKTGPFPFCICWANEDWTRSWDGMSGEVLLAQNHTSKSDFRFIQDVTPLLKHPDYIRHEGKPVLLIYRADKLASAKRTVKAWRAWCRKEGIGELHLCAVQSFGFDDPRPLGFDAAVEFPPHCVHDKRLDTVFRKTFDNLPELVERFSGSIFDYQAFADAFINRPREPYTLHPGCFTAWDNTARREKTAHVFHNFSIDKYQAWLSANLAKAGLNEQGGLVFVNAWNEWAEGAVLEPDHHFGYGLLEATRRTNSCDLLHFPMAFWKYGRPLLPYTRLSASERILMIGHDAHPHGAQINMLHMARSLKRDFHIDVVILLLQGGSMVAEYERVGTTIVLGQADGWLDTFASLAHQYLQLGICKAICNTVVTGEAAKILYEHGYRVISLVHELPSLIESHGLQSRCWHVAANANNIVFASDVVAREFCGRYWPDPEKIFISPQGIVFNQYHAKRTCLRKDVRKELELSPTTRIIMGCGYGDFRKGIDLFVQMAGEVARKTDDVAFLWVGSLDQSLEPHILADIEGFGLKNRMHITGRVDDTARYYIASDLFALTSREDPFPSVVMEAFDAGLPVVAFSGGGGYVDIVDAKTGALVPYLGIHEMANELTLLLKNNFRRQQLGEYVHHFCRETFSYSTYLSKLLALLNGVPAQAVAKGILKRQAWYEDSLSPRISVIVPNYNYGRYLELRLRTILDQTLPPMEVIVLDDASTDYSCDIIEAIAADSPIPIRLIHNESNTGNPFIQWAKGLAEATGDLVWIAEADDYCEPILLETLAREFVDENVVLAWSDSIVVDALGHSEGYEYKRYYGEKFGDYWYRHFKMAGSELFEKCLTTANVLPNASAVLFRRQVVDVNLSLIQHYRFSGDWWFWISLAEKGTVSYRSEALNYHRRHGQSVMGEVLREGEKLIPETLAFYHRLGEYKKHLFTPKAVLGVFDGAEDMYRLFPKLQDQSYWLRKHPIFKTDYQELVDLFNPVAAFDATSKLTPALLALSEDTLADHDTALRLIHHLEDEHDLDIFFLGDPDKVISFIESSPIDVQQVHIMPTSKSSVVKAAKRKMDTKLRCATLKYRNVEEVIGKYSHIISHGLLAHCLIANIYRNKTGHWQIIAGKEFDVLLGSLSTLEEVTVEKLQMAIDLCSSIQHIDEPIHHVIGRLTLTARKHISIIHLGVGKTIKRPVSTKSQLTADLVRMRDIEYWSL